MAHDVVVPFVFENIPVRGAVVQLRDAWHRLKLDHDYTEAVSSTLGEAAAATTLIAQSLKSDSSVTLQISGSGPLSMLVMQVTSSLHMRGLATTRTEPVLEETFRELVADAHCAITVEHQQAEKPYQGIIDVSGVSLSDCLEDYYQRSAQIPSHLTLLSADSVCGGIVLQQMPGRGEALEDDWRRLGLLAATLGTRDLSGGIGAALIGQLFAEDDVRVFRGRPAAFRCRCSRARAANALQLLGGDECTSACAEEGQLVVTCEYCGRRQIFDAVDVAELFAERPAPHSDAVH